MTGPIGRRDFLAAAGGFLGAAVVVGSAGWLRHLGLTESDGPFPVPAAPVDLTVICKEAWGARPVQGEFRPHTVERLTVHHTAAFLGHVSEAPSLARRHQRHHQDAGWPDLAYHFLVDSAGHVYEGRPVDAAGDTFTEYDPTGHFLVCAEGNFNEQDLPPRQLAAVADVLAWGADRFDVDPATIAGHRAYAATSCPGTALAAVIDSGDLRRAVEDRLASGPPGFATVCGPDASAFVADLEAGGDPVLPAPAQPTFHLRDDNGPGPADRSVPFGESGWLPITGRFGPS